MAKNMLLSVHSLEKREPYEEVAMTVYRKISFLALIMVLLVWVPAASAHRPESAAGDTVTTLPDISTSYAYYQAIEGRSQVDVWCWLAPLHLT